MNKMLTIRCYLRPISRVGRFNVFEDFYISFYAFGMLGQFDRLINSFYDSLNLT